MPHEFVYVMLLALVPGSVLVVIVGIVMGVLVVQGKRRERELEDAVLNWSLRALDAENSLETDADEDEEWRESGG